MDRGARNRVAGVNGLEATARRLFHRHVTDLSPSWIRQVLGPLTAVRLSTHDDPERE